MDYLARLPIAVNMVAVIVFDGIAMSMFEGYVKSKEVTLLFGTLILESIAWLFLMAALRRGELGVANIFWDIGSWLFVTLVAIFFFKERYSWLVWVGFLVGLVALILLSVGGIKG